MIDKYYLKNGTETRLAETEVQRVSQRTYNYLEKSKVLLLGVVNMDDEYGQSDQLDLKPQQKLSRELIHEAAYLKKVLDNSDQRRLQALVGELERILLQIVNLEETYDLESVDLIKTSVRRNGILLKINVEEMHHDDARLEGGKDESNNKKKTKRI